MACWRETTRPGRRCSVGGTLAVAAGRHDPVDEQAGAHREPPPGQRSVERQREAQRDDGMRRDAGERAPFAHRFARASDVQVLQVAEPAVNGAQVVEGAAAAEIVALDERHRSAALRRVVRDRQAVDAAADDEHVERALGEPVRIAKHVGLYYPAWRRSTKFARTGNSTSTISKSPGTRSDRAGSSTIWISITSRSCIICCASSTSTDTAAAGFSRWAAAPASIWRGLPAAARSSPASTLPNRRLRWRGRTSSSRGSQGDFRVADGEHLPFGDDSFDLVYAHGVVQYTANPERLVAECRRVLKPGGEAVFQVYNRISWLNALSQLMKVGLEHQDAPVLLKFSIGEFKRLLARLPRGARSSRSASR